jgi:hypothetical protein
MAMEGDPKAGLKMLEEGFARQREIATTGDFPTYPCLLTEVLARLVIPRLADRNPCAP